jgi:hypothetical protein
MKHEATKQPFITWQTTALILFFILMGILAYQTAKDTPTGASPDTGSWDYAGSK